MLWDRLGSHRGVLFESPPRRCSRGRQVWVVLPVVLSVPRVGMVEGKCGLPSAVALLAAFVVVLVELGVAGPPQWRRRVC